MKDVMHRPGRAAVLWVAVWIGAATLAGPADALVVESGNDNTAAPAGLDYFDNVGKAGAGTAIYLGGGYVLGVAHVNQPTIFINGDYRAMQSVKILRNPNNSKSDLQLYELIYDDPADQVELAALPTVNIANTGRPAEDPVLMVGTGRDRADGGTGTAPFAWSNDRPKLWGENRISSGLNSFTVQGRDVWGRTLTFNSPGRSTPTHEAQATNGDSGGAVFAHANGEYVLTGLMHAIDPIVEGGNPTYYGDKTIISDISQYLLELPALAGDVDRDLDADADDIDALFALIGSTNGYADLNGSGLVDDLDVHILVNNIFDTEFGDANLDGRIDGIDGDILAANFGQTGGWAEGDFNGDTLVNGLDASILLSNFGYGDEQFISALPTLGVPEPATAALAGLGAIALATRRRR